MSDAVDPALVAALDELGAVPPEEFVATRDRLARALKADGNTGAAAALRSRRRPSVVAWSVNRVARDRGDLVNAMFAAADDVRGAVARGDGDALRAAMRAQRTRLAELTDLAVDRAASVSPNAGAHREAIGRTWEAAAADDAVREPVRSGTLSTELQPGGTVSGAPSAGGAASAPTGTRRRLPRSMPTEPARRVLPRDELALRRAEETLADARRELADAAAATEAADDDVARATRAAERARDTRERAQRRVERAEQALAERKTR
ncbi:MAG: hypothetical protein ACHQIG_07515 [Acidimicrobiia bacterium]